MKIQKIKALACSKCGSDRVIVHPSPGQSHHGSQECLDCRAYVTYAGNVTVSKADGSEYRAALDVRKAIRASNEARAEDS